MGEQTCKTPIEELLRAVPLDECLDIENRSDDGFVSYHHIPIGREAHEAADEIERLTAENKNLKKSLLHIKYASQRFGTFVCRTAEEQGE